MHEHEEPKGKQPRTRGALADITNQPNSVPGSVAASASPSAGRVEHELKHFSEHMLRKVGEPAKNADFDSLSEAMADLIVEEYPDLISEDVQGTYTGFDVSSVADGKLSKLNMSGQIHHPAEVQNQKVRFVESITIIISTIIVIISITVLYLYLYIRTLEHSKFFPYLNS